MEYSSAEMICVLKVNTQCEACKVKFMQILQKIRGVYNITIDGEEGTVKVTGRVNPNTLLSVLERYGKHAEVKYVKFDGEVVERNPPYYGEYGSYAPYNGVEYSSYPPPQLPCPHSQHQWHYYQHFSQPPPPPPPPPPPLAPYPVAPPPPPPPAPFWTPQPPPPPPHPYGYGSFWMPPRPPNHFPTGETSSQNKQSQCAMM